MGAPHSTYNSCDSILHLFVILLFSLPAASTLQGQAPDGSFANRHGRHAVGHIDDFKALQQQILEGSALLRKMEATLYSPSTPQEFSLHQVRDPRTKSTTDQLILE